MSVTCSKNGERLEVRFTDPVTLEDLDCHWKELSSGIEDALVDFREVGVFPGGNEIRQFAMTAKRVSRSRVAFVCSSLAVFGAVRALTTQCDFDGVYNVFTEVGDAVSWLGPTSGVN